ncbi:3-hydroxyacyl-ACP dehydratase FabZ family protein [Ramlibacter sp. MMS24-I3-19]|uniref:3-hydroxyacyl-ACP dehydratase FabZ family protein n=1 Tax=Ramlibacter sp. MMS24-I3-19 TaxID=3416606 RepID=UPI003D04EF4C
MTELSYPIELDREEIHEVLPHRGDIQFVSSLTVLQHDRYQGHAHWPENLPILQGHFPGMPIVPGVFLIEAVAQVAGAGMLVGDAYARSMGPGYVGVLVGVRKCSFKRPVLAGEAVVIDATSRQMSQTAATVTGKVTVRGDEVATIEIFVVNVPRDSLDMQSQQAS